MTKFMLVLAFLLPCGNTQPVMNVNLVPITEQQCEFAAKHPAVYESWFNDIDWSDQQPEGSTLILVCKRYLDK